MAFFLIIMDAARIVAGSQNRDFCDMNNLYNKQKKVAGWTIFFCLEH